MKDTILVIAAHPDDEIIGCGGTILKHVKNKDSVYSLILSKGVQSRFKKNNSSKKIQKYKESLNNETLKANSSLGVKKIFSEDFPDNNFDSVSLLDIVKKIEFHFDKIQPSIVYTHSNFDLNIDHQITFRAVLTASRPKIDSKISKIFSFEIPSSSDWSFGLNNRNFNPNYFVGIEKEVNRKIKALKYYKSEMRKFPNSRSLKNIQNLAAVRGATVGLKAAEAFEIVRYIKK